MSMWDGMAGRTLRAWVLVLVVIAPAAIALYALLLGPRC